MVNPEKTAERRRKAEAYRDLVRRLSGVARIYRPTASSIFDSLSRAQLNERHAESSRLAGETLFRENPEANLPEELSDKAIAQYLASAGDFYGNAATDLILISDLKRAFKYFRKAAECCRRAADVGVEDASPLLEKRQEYLDKAAMVRQALARRRILTRRFGLGFWARLRRKI
jgi:hypothetical protein